MRIHPATLAMLLTACSLACSAQDLRSKKPKRGDRMSRIGLFVGGRGGQSRPALTPRTTNQVQTQVAQPKPRVAPPSSTDTRTPDERLLAFQIEQAKAGSPTAQRDLSRRYAEGKGVEKNETIAKIWADAAEQNEKRIAKGEQPSSK